ncbi:MAG: hypothetical protein IJT15_02615 [Rickettsiales bacterium]|nr:hypothetical protein [Rickettsiales bacterium]
MQFIDRYKDIVKYTKKVLFTSFVITAMVDCVFLMLSFYVYLAFNSLNKQSTYLPFAVFTIFLIFCCLGCYILISKRQKLLSGLSRFLEYIVYNNILKIGIFINNRANSSMPAKRLMKDIGVARGIFYSNIITSIMEIPFVLCLLFLIFWLSKSNGLMCIIYTLFLLLATIIKKASQTDKQKNIIENEVIANKTFFSEDLFNNIFNNYKYIHNNMDIDKLLQYYSNIDEARYEKFIQSKEEIITYPSMIKMITLLFQIILVLNSIYLFTNHNIKLGGFILTIGFIYQFLQKTSWIFQISQPTLHTIQAIKRMAKTIKIFGQRIYKSEYLEKERLLNNDNEIQAIEDEFLEYGNHKQQLHQDSRKNEIIINNLHLNDNLSFSYRFQEGNIYVIDGDNYFQSSKLFKEIINCSIKKSKEISISIQNNSYKDIFYCPIFPAILYGKIIDIITNFEENVNTTKLDNILNILRLNQDLKQAQISTSTILNTSNIDNIDIQILKKINLASALYSNANILLLEEPFLIIDKNTQDDLINFLAGLKQIGKIIIISSKELYLINTITHNNGIYIKI